MKTKGIRSTRPESVRSQIGETQRLRYQKIREGLRRITEMNDTLDERINRTVKKTMENFLKENLI